MAQESQTKPSSPKPWYKTWWGILILIIFWFISVPVFLINYIWNKTKWNQGAKIGASIAVVAVVGFILLSFGGSTPTSESESASDAVAQNTEAKTEEATSPAEPEPVLSEEEQVRKLVADQLSGNNNLKKPYIREIDVVEQPGGGWGVFVEYNAGDNLTTNLRKGSIESKMSDIYIALYTSDKDIRTASVAAYFPLVDKYGNDVDGLVYKTVLDKEEAEKVNWDAPSATL